MCEKDIVVKDFEQKNRHIPRKITTVAIEKVKQKKFDGFTDEQEKFIQSMHKLVLKEALRLNLENNTDMMEVGIMIDLHTWEYWVIPGKPGKVDLKYNKDAYSAFIKANKNQLMFIHNHPSTGTFSGQDLQYFCNNIQFYIVDVVGNDGKIYTLRKKVNFDIKILELYNNLAKQYYDKGYINNNGTLAMKEVLRQASLYGILYER